MRKMGLSILVLVGMFAFCSVKTYAQCAEPTGYRCGCDGSQHSGFVISDLGEYFPSVNATCCGQVIPNIYMQGSGDCLSAKNITKTTQKELAKLALHNRVFLVACNGDFVPYTNSTAPEQAQGQTWSANRAILADEGKLATRTR